ncbi:PTS mannose/fructose/sorbose/N-acetylgalactosamine transporter subunit IIC [Holdemania filiformis]|jgi:mannose/fructose/N-acetylgalactosamine-specific phosphotransferase system component IIC|uniref:PTS system sorbose-specific iic component n=1 Tax=Holdemania filiformis DSM 12042 TaxID=545696 RepID=B9Y2V5_9FIRM|nr:PTS sugar transporter subunit IIC [Holdemania filiformis]EEF69680.1 PTS system sorbose-specific iic component [Holdemania filiformis DSM 12042]
MDVSISLFQAFLMGVVYYLGIIGTPWTTVLGSASLFQKPLVAGTLVGLILGHPAEGVIIGAAIQLPYIAFISAGGTIPSDPGLAGVLGTAFAIVGNVDPATAITIAIPFGLLGTVVWVLHMTIDVAFVHMADKAAEQGDLKKVCFLHVVPPQIVAFAISVIPVMLGAYFGADYMARLVAMLSNDVLHVLQVIGGVLPALGVAMNLRSISRPNSMAFYMLGFILSVYLGLDTIVIAVLGFIIAWFYTQLQKENG